MKIHSTAIVDPGAELGSDVTVGPYCTVGPGVQLGDRCNLIGHVALSGPSTFGAENEFHPFSVVGAPPQDLKYKGEPTRLIVGNKNVFRECVTVNRGTVTGRSETTIGNYNLFMATSHVAHDCVIGDRNVFANGVGLAGHVLIEHRVILGGMVGLHQFVRVGEGAFISAGSMVGLDIPPFCIAQGDRCHLRGINVIGLERAGLSADDISAIRKSYRHLFSKVGNVKDKVATLPSELCENMFVRQMLTFIEGTERGILSPTTGRSSKE